MPTGAIMLRVPQKSKCDVLITGGAGFIGANLAAHLLAHSDSCIALFDDLARPGAAHNITWLRGQAGSGRLDVIHGDPGQSSRLADAASRVDEIYQLDRNDSSIENPPGTSDSSFPGTASILEGARRSRRNPIVISTSVGNQLRTGQGTASPVCDSLFPCSKSDRLVQDYAQLYGLRTVLLRCDTITGPRQFGEGQDWVARAVFSLLSSGNWVIPARLSRWHNVLHVSDAVNAILAARAYIGKTAGHAYDLSGAAPHTISVEQMIQLIERFCHRSVEIGPLQNGGNEETRPNFEDGPFRIDTSWRARRSLEETVRDVVGFWHANRQAIAESNRLEWKRAEVSRVQAA